ncbi:hypothetical protein N0V94_000344 [Neodidymelliopsis sp. IMI 364377]|nr:hypothetical protein N0V94_000344 [Neodidymelliopsis sp. IMI 364377]
MTVDPPAIKKRGRPSKVATEGAAAPEKPAVRSASTKTKPTAKAKTVDSMKEKKKTLTRVSDYKIKKETPAPKATSTATSAAQKATPVTPTNSKILDEVKATGTLSKRAATQTPPQSEPEQPFIPPIPGPAPVVPITPAATLESSASADIAPPPSPPPAQEVEQPMIPPVPGPAPVAPIQQPVDDTPSKPFIPPTTASPNDRANIIPPKPRATTIPLPRNPITAPSPTSEPRPRVNFAKPAPSAPRPPPNYPRRIIEPTPNAKLPPKYKKTARQVTSIIVGIPFIIVVGYELYGRWKTQINVKFEERARRAEQPKTLSG